MSPTIRIRCRAGAAELRVRQERRHTVTPRPSFVYAENVTSCFTAFAHTDAQPCTRTTGIALLLQRVVRWQGGVARGRGIRARGGYSRSRRRVTDVVGAAHFPQRRDQVEELLQRGTRRVVGRHRRSALRLAANDLVPRNHEQHRRQAGGVVEQEPSADLSRRNTEDRRPPRVCTLTIASPVPRSGDAVPTILRKISRPVRPCSLVVRSGPTRRRDRRSPVIPDN